MRVYPHPSWLDRTFLSPCNSAYIMYRLYLRNCVALILPVVKCLSVCLCVCLSHAGIVSQRLNMQSRKQRHTFTAGAAPRTPFDSPPHPSRAPRLKLPHQPFVATPLIHTVLRDWRRESVVGGSIVASVQYNWSVGRAPSGGPGVGSQVVRRSTLSATPCSAAYIYRVVVEQVLPTATCCAMCIVITFNL